MVRHSVSMAMGPALVETLSMVGRAAGPSNDDWWIIGSAAVALHGAEVWHVKDVDLMMSGSDARALLSRVCRELETAPSPQFRSEVFGIWDAPPIPVEVFGGFRFAIDGDWRPVTFMTRHLVKIDDTAVYIPGSNELVALLHLFGRPKDLERARLLVE